MKLPPWGFLIPAARREAAGRRVGAGDGGCAARREWGELSEGNGVTT